MAGVVTVVGGLLTLLWVLVDGNSAQAPTQLELVRIALTILLGTGGLFGLYLAWRRQRSTEIALQQKERDQADVARAYTLQERTALASETDAAARRITDLYTKAVEQLGSDKAPVRLGGLYALERLAQDHPDQRQTIVNVLCAYLRMPYTLPGDTPPDDADDKLLDTYRDRVQEREVRLTAQRILTHHLNPGDPDSPAKTFWNNIDLDLTSATLINFDLSGCRIHNATFPQTRFAGYTSFAATQFTGYANFHDATFTGYAEFNDATFTGNARFDKAKFIGNATFSKAWFTGYAMFNEAKFTNGATFSEATFTGHAPFYGVTFTEGAMFNEAKFTRGATFREATFIGYATFTRAEFTEDTSFDNATFTEDAWFTLATFTEITSFRGAQFAQEVPADVAQYVTQRNSEDDTGAPATSIRR